MRITFYANTMALVESKNNRILFDPWITFNNFSLSGFYNFPKTKFTQADVAAINPDYIYISHTHPDHFDPITMSLFNKETPILISYFENNFTERNIKRMGFHNVQVVRDGLKLKGGDYCWIEPSSSAPELDSIIVLKMDDLTMINFNDNTFNRQQCQSLMAKFKKIDIGLIPSAAHGPWPMFYDNLTLDEKKAHADRRAQDQKERFVDFIKELHPKWVVPFSGGVISGGEKAERYIYSGINRRSDVVNYALKETDFIPIMLSGGNSYDFAKEVRIGEYEETYFTSESQKDYLEEIANMPSKFSSGGLFYVAPSERVDLGGLIKSALQKVAKWQKGLGKDPTAICFLDIGEDFLYRISLNEMEVSKVKESAIADFRYEIFRMPYECLLGLLTRHYFWSNVTPHVTHFRKGDYDPNLLLMLNFLSV